MAVVRVVLVLLSQRMLLLFATSSAEALLGSTMDATLRFSLVVLDSVVEDSNLRSFVLNDLAMATHMAELVRGDFGDFDEGFYEGNQGFGQGFGGYGNNGGQRFHRPRQTGGYQGRGNGRFVPRGRGRYTPVMPRQPIQDLTQGAAQRLPALGVQGVAVAQTTTITAPNPVPQPAQVHHASRQDVPADQEVAAKLKEAKNSKKLEKVLCFRFIQLGHYAIDCTAELCLYCELATHKSADCPKLTMPKPTAPMYGMACDALLFFDIPKSHDLRPKPDCGKIGRVRVQGGTMTVRQVIEELRWLVPGDHQWDISPIDEFSFRVMYPTKMDRARVRKIGDINVEGTNFKKFFEDWLVQNVDKWQFSDVWVRFHGCPDELRRDYLALFGLGSLVGKTKEIDMQFTRDNGIVRAFITVVNASAIPERLDHSYDGEGFGVQVEVEGNGDLEMDDPNDGNNDSSKKNEGLGKGNAEQPPKENDTNQHVNGDDSNKNSGPINGVEALSMKFGSFEVNMSQKGTSAHKKSWFDLVDEEEEMID
ncbi:hypothetical protein ACQ4PT_009040 [Festuca glaucescens]